MQRTKNIKMPDAILTSDWHLREDQPRCRTDDFQSVQWQKVDFIRELQQQYGCSVIHAGDLFHHWKPSPYLLSETIQHLPADFWTVYGQHDLPQHSLELKHKCGIDTLYHAGKLHILPQGHWGQTPGSGGNWTIKRKNIYTWHVLTYKSKEPFPGIEAPKAHQLLKKYPQYDLIVTGDNHKSFTETHEGRLLVNPGSLTRQTADQTDHEPCVYLWYADTNTVERVVLPFDRNVISREHIERKEQDDKRLEAFVSRLDSEFEALIDFEQNMERFFQTNRIHDKTKQIIIKAMENE